MIQAVLFDLDETLHDRQESLVHFLATQYDRFPALHSLEKNLFTKRFLELDDNGRIWKDLVYATLIEEYGLSCKTEDLLKDYIGHMHEYARLVPDVLAVLQSLKNQGLKLGIITNGRHDFQMSVIISLGLTDLMDVILVSESEKISKPNPAIFQRALAQIHVVPEECVFVGDNPIADISGAHAIGMKTIWVENARVSPPVPEIGCGVLKKFCDFQAILSRLK